jgi:hypothetical protein
VRQKPKAMKYSPTVSCFLKHKFDCKPAVHLQTQGKPSPLPPCNCKPSKCFKKGVARTPPCAVYTVFYITMYYLNCINTHKHTLRNLTFRFDHLQCSNYLYCYRKQTASIMFFSCSRFKVGQSLHSLVHDLLFVDSVECQHHNHPPLVNISPSSRVCPLNCLRLHYTQTQ